MIEWCREVLDMFLKFVGTGMIQWLVSVAILGICFVKCKTGRTKIIYPAFFVYFIFFNPIIYGTIGMRFMSGMYWRMLWLVPTVAILAYGGTMLCQMFTQYWKKIICLAVICLLMVITGKPMFTSENFIPAQNYYQIPQVSIDVADEIMKDLGDKDTGFVVVPDELLCSVRQYTTRINLLYGRDAYGYINQLAEMQTAVHDEMVKEQPDVHQLSIYAKAKNVEYIVFNSLYHKEYDKIQMYDYKFCTSIDGYDIYKYMEE